MKILAITPVWMVIAILLSAKSADTNLFPYKNSWLGGDAAYSIPLDPVSTVWLFGDTFTGAQRKPETMIHNSIAIRTCHGVDCQVTYWWSGMQTGTASSFFKTPETDYFWPLDGVVTGKLYVFLEQMHATAGGGAFGFDYSGVVLATVANPKERPDQWRITYQAVSLGNVAIPGIAAIVRRDEKYLTAFTLFRGSKSQPFLGLLRIPLSDLAAAGNSTNWKYLGKGQQWLPWKRSTSPSDAAKILEGNITEMSVTFHRDRSQWIAVYPTPGFLSGTASYSTADKLDGLWSKSRPLFQYSEMQKDDGRYTPNVFCYAAKEHPELETPNEMALTYACNSTKEPEILKDTRLYRPVLVKQPYPGR